MIANPMDVLTAFPVRKSKKQKAAFRAEVTEYLEKLGYTVQEEKASLGAVNLVTGDPVKAKYLVTAHYDTCARLPIPNLITPCSLFGFVGYQLVMALVMMLPMVLTAAAVGYLTKDADLASLCGYAVLLAVIVLMMVGPRNPSNANDNTSGVVSVLEIAKSMPEKKRGEVCFVLFDLEEVGLIGSSDYRNKHKKAVKNQLVLNLDCVGDGDYLYLFPTRKLKKDAEKMEALRSICGTFGKKSLTLREKGFSIYPSDQANFPLGVGICALRKGKLGLYLDKIHTPKDTILEQTNVNILRSALTSLICCGAVDMRKEEEYETV